MRPARQKQLGRRAVVLKNAGRGVGGAAPVSGRRSRAPGSLPHRLPRLHVQGDDEARPVLIVGHDHLLLEDDGRGAEAVDGIIRPEVLAPELLARVIPCLDEELLRVREAGDHAVLVDRGRAGGEGGVVAVLLARRQSKLFHPQFLAVLLLKADHQPLAPRVLRARQENLVAPEDGLAVAPSRNRHPPAEVLLGPRQRDILRGADPRAVGPAESGPLLRARFGRPERRSQDPQTDSSVEVSHGFPK